MICVGSQRRKKKRGESVEEEVKLMYREVAYLKEERTVNSVFL